MSEIIAETDAYTAYSVNKGSFGRRIKIDIRNSIGMTPAEALEFANRIRDYIVMNCRGEHE